jgi:hypothetical protein
LALALRFWPLLPRVSKNLSFGKFGEQKLMKTMQLTVLMTGLCFLNFPLQIVGQTIYVPQSAPYTNDAYTVLLQHFDGTTTGAITGTVTYTNGIFGQGARLNFNDCIVFSMGALSQGTVEFWAAADNLTNSIQNIVIATLSPNNWGTFLSGIAQTNYVYSVYVDVNDDWQGMITTNTFSKTITANSWHHYATTWGSEGFRFYVDGNPVYTNAVTGGQYGPTGSWQVGANSAAGNNGSGFNGIIDELRISSIQRVFAPVPSPSLVKALFLQDNSLTVGSNYQVQVSSNLLNWTNQGSVFTATNSYWLSTNYWLVSNWNQLFFRMLPQ